MTFGIRLVNNTSSCRPHLGASRPPRRQHTH